VIANTKEVGRWHLLECYEGIEGWSMALLTRLMDVSSREIIFYLGVGTYRQRLSNCSGQQPKFMSSSPK
jgi:hypothetical protein